MSPRVCPALHASSLPSLPPQGRLKEQDDLIDLIQHLIVDSGDGLTHFSVEEAFAMVEGMIAEHVEKPAGSKLKK